MQASGLARIIGPGRIVTDSGLVHHNLQVARVPNISAMVVVTQVSKIFQRAFLPAYSSLGDYSYSAFWSYEASKFSRDSSGFSDCDLFLRFPLGQSTITPEQDYPSLSISRYSSLKRFCGLMYEIRNWGNTPVLIVIMYAFLEMLSIPLEISESLRSS